MTVYYYHYYYYYYYYYYYCDPPPPAPLSPREGTHGLWLPGTPALTRVSRALGQRPQRRPGGPCHGRPVPTRQDAR